MSTGNPPAVDPSTNWLTSGPVGPSGPAYPGVFSPHNPNVWGAANAIYGSIDLNGYGDSSFCFQVAGQQVQISQTDHLGNLQQFLDIAVKNSVDLSDISRAVHQLVINRVLDV